MHREFDAPNQGVIKMRIFIKVIIISIITIFFFIGCDGEVTIYSYLSDIISVGSEKESLYTTANLVIEGLDSPDDIEFLKTHINGFTNEEVISKDFSNALSFDIKIPIVYSDKILEDDTSDFLLYLIIIDENDYYGISYKMNQEVISEISDYIESTYYQSFNVNDFKISIIIDNDTRKTQDILGYSVYVQAKPYPLEYKAKINYRDKIKIVLSEILQKAYQDSSYKQPFFVIKKGA